MSKNTYEVIPVNKPIDREELIRVITAYILSHLKKCEVETESSCAVRFESSATRPAFNVALATVTAATMPTAWPVFGTLLATAGYRVVYMKNLKKEVLKLIRAYVS